MWDVACALCHALCKVCKVLCYHMSPVQTRPCLSTRWALNCCFAWTFGSTAMLPQGGVHPPVEGTSTFSPAVWGCLWQLHKVKTLVRAGTHVGRTSQPGWKPLYVHSIAKSLCRKSSDMYPPPPCISYANVRNYYGPYTQRSLDKGVACAQHIQLPTHTCASAWYDCTLTSAHIPNACKHKKALGT